MAADEASPGWDAIDAALKPVYGDREPRHFGTAIPWSLGGPDPLPGLSAYPRDDHWHVVTYGFTELDGKETEDPETSGFGFELTIRVARAKDEEEAPRWALGHLQNLARYVFQSGNAFGVGHHVPLNGPICQGAPTAIQAILFARDPELGEFSSPNGKAEFLQIVGITTDELGLVQEWDAEAFLQEFAVGSPLLITDLKRPSILSDPARAKALREKADRDGSSMASTYVQQSAWKAPVWELGALNVDSVLKALKGRTLHARPFELHGEELTVSLDPDAQAAAAFDDGVLRLRLTPGLAEDMLATLKPKRGDYSWKALPGFVLRVAPTPITDARGAIVDTVG